MNRAAPGRVAALLGGLLLLMSIVVRAPALELSQGPLKLVLAESTGRFLLYYIENPLKKQYVPLFFSDDPRTSVLTIIIDGKLYRLGDSSAFQISVEHQNDTAAFVFTSNTLTVTEEFALTRSTGASAADGVVVTVTMRNISKTAESVGARLLLDTTLGEHSSGHFHTPVEGAIQHETSIIPSTADSSVISESSAESKIGLQVMLSGAEITQPDRVILANWKRLNESPWDFEVNRSRDFSLLPYSINDSAVALYYNPQSVPPGGSRRVVIALGNKSPGGYTGAPAAPPPESQVAAPAAGSQADASPVQPGHNLIDNSALENDYNKTVELLDRINSMLSQPPGSLTPDQMDQIRQALKLLEARKSQYAQ